MTIGAIVTDSMGQETTANEVTVACSEPLAGEDTPVVYELPLPGGLLTENVPYRVQVTSGDWQSGTLSAADFQSVSFSVDSEPIGRVDTADYDFREVEDPESGEKRTIAVPVWRVNYVPPAGSAGNSAVPATISSSSRLPSTTSSNFLSLDSVSENLIVSPIPAASNGPSA